MMLFLLLIRLLFSQPVFTVSCVFANGDYIPSRFSCEGQNVNPEINIKHLPKNTKSLALILEDPDPAFGTFDHWVVWNIPPTEKIKENSSPGKTGRNSSGQNAYMGPCPPNGVHTYHFRVYALDNQLQLPDSAGKQQVLSAMQGHILGTAETTGRFFKKQVFQK